MAKILYYHQHFSTRSGAAGTRSYSMAKHLVEAGHDVTVVCGSSKRAETGLSRKFIKGRRCGLVDGIRVLEFDLAYSNSDSFIKRAITFIRFSIRSTLVAVRSDCNLIFATSTPLTVGIPGVVARWIKGTKFVFEVRDLWPELPKAMGVIKNPVILSLMSLLELITYRSADRLIGLAPGIVKGIVRRGVAPERVTLIPNGCDLELFSTENDKWRPDGIEPDDFMAVYTGAHGMANGLGILIDVARALKEKQAWKVKIVLVGDGMMKPELVRLRDENELENLIFLDLVSKPRLAGLLSAADLGLQLLANIPAFYFGTSPNKFFDYLAAGKPVLVNYPGWQSELVKEYRCGVGVPGDNPKVFANALVELSSNSSKLTEMGECARVLAESEFDRAQQAAKFRRWLEAQLES